MAVVCLLVRRSWRRWSPLVSGQLFPWRREPLVMLMVGMLQVMVLLMPLARVLQVLYRVMLCVG